MIAVQLRSGDSTRGRAAGRDGGKEGERRRKEEEESQQEDTGVKANTLPFMLWEE